MRGAAPVVEDLRERGQNCRSLEGCDCSSPDVVKLMESDPVQSAGDEFVVLLRPNKVHLVSGDNGFEITITKSAEELHVECSRQAKRVDSFEAMVWIETADRRTDADREVLIETESVR